MTKLTDDEIVEQMEEALQDKLSPEDFVLSLARAAQVPQEYLGFAPFQEPAPAPLDDGEAWKNIPIVGWSEK